MKETNGEISILKKGDVDMTSIRIIDSIMGSGKSTAIKRELEKMFSKKKFGNNPIEKFLYVCPFLKHIEDEVDEEVTGFISDVPSANFKQPKGGYNVKTKEIETKLDNLSTLILKNENIATTHSLFKMMTNEIKELLILNGYHVIIDETIDLVRIFSMDDEDYEWLLENEVLTYNNETNVVDWNDDREKEYDGILKSYKQEFKTGTVYKHYAKDTKNGIVNLLAWTFDEDAFKTINFTILTYMFEGSMMRCYFDMHNIKYTKHSIKNFNIVDYSSILDKKYREKANELINIYDGKLNDIGKKPTALSVSWFNRNKALKKQLKNNMVNYRKNIIKSDANKVLWTTFKDHSTSLKGNGISLDTIRSSGNFLQCNEIGSNEYGDRTTVIYSLNRYMPLDYKKYFESNNVTVFEDMWGLSSMIQFIWRSSIRNNESIDVYIPSKRMREMLIDWLNS